VCLGLLHALSKQTLTLTRCDRLSIASLQGYRSKRKSNAWIDNTDGSELVCTIGALGWIRCTDARGLFVAVIEPVVNVNSDVDWASEHTIASNSVKGRLADAVDDQFDRVRVEPTQMVEYCSRERISCGCINSNVITAGKLIGFRASIGELVVEGNPSEDSLEVLAWICGVSSDSKLKFRK
ncbi:hypothetical protein, partial [Saliphagus infecundisoli]